ncbi:KRAB-A domain-containing protein 2-like [Aphis craccivora]|uniref:KRAB-A domain-containing protein 2-like n=1 Tax=Aphis craccivora TaxID=307492 RepID=A0A6G0YZE6_APHCR|nr:KRAB-A domain-containing protein 2-like [Aphis craccivora]
MMCRKVDTHLIKKYSKNFKIYRALNIFSCTTLGKRATNLLVMSTIMGNEDNRNPIRHPTTHHLETFVLETAIKLNEIIVCSTFFSLRRKDYIKESKMYFKTVVEMKIMKDYSLVRKYNFLIIINEKDYLMTKKFLYYVKTDELFDIFHKKYSDRKPWKTKSYDH